MLYFTVKATSDSDLELGYAAQLLVLAFVDFTHNRNARTLEVRGTFTRDHLIQVFGTQQYRYDITEDKPANLSDL